MSVKPLHGQMSAVDKNGNTQLLHQETSAQVVLVNTDKNTQGINNSSAIPEDVTNAQDIVDKVGLLAFKSKIGYSDLSDDLIAKNISTASSTQIPSIEIVKEIQEKVTDLDDGNYIVVDETDNGIAIPESEINDDVTSSSLTWSSNKINTQITEIIDLIDEVDNEANSVFYVVLLKNQDGSFTAQHTVAEIEAAFNKNKAIWVISESVLLPLRKRQDINTWIFSGYTETQAYDITITPSAVTFTYTDLITTEGTLPNPNVLKLTGAVNAIYDGSEEVEVVIPTIDGGSSTTITTKTWTEKDMK